MDTQKMYSQWICGEQYDVFRYYIPNRVESRLNTLRKWFRVLDRDRIPYQYKRRKNPIEHAETAVMILGRIDQLCTLDVPIVAGSGYISSKPWATFGEVPNAKSQLQFRDVEDISDYYHNLIVKGASSASYLHFRVCPNLPMELSNKHNKTVHYVVSMALLLLCDILENVGPDCEEFYDLFTNDTRVGREHVDIFDWSRTRQTVLGKKGKTREKRVNIRLGQVYDPPVPLASRTDFIELPESEDLAKGEKLVEAKKPKIKFNYDEIDNADDGSPAIDVDDDYADRVKGRLGKYTHLGLGIGVPDGVP